MIIIAFMCFTGVADAATNIWQAETNVNASYAGNWSLGRAPISSDDILLDGTSVANLIWDEAATNVVASWTQMPGYTGSVTFETVYGNTGFTNFTITGDAVVKGGNWTHSVNSSTESKRLSVTIGGDFDLDGATITGDSLGYGAGRGPGAGSGEWFGGGYGGYAGGSSNPKFTAKSYGSVLRPVNIGSGGGNPYGGGAIRLRVAGALDISGTVTANGGDWGSSRGGGSGGSIWITALAMSGDGSISANGGNSGGGGGRIAIELGADGWDNWDGTVNAHGGAGAYCGAAGTIRKWDPSMTAHDGLVLVDNNSNVTATNAIITPLPAFAESTEILARTAWHVTGKGNLALLAGAEIEELEMDAQTRLELNGEKLVVGRLVVDTVRFPIGTYTIADSPLFTDVIGTGEIQVVGSKHVGLIVVRLGRLCA